MTIAHPFASNDFSTMDDDALAAAVSTLAAHIHAATYRLLVLIAELDRREVWAAQGALSCAHWLSWACGIDTHTARKRPRGPMPSTRAAASPSGTTTTAPWCCTGGSRPRWVHAS